MLDAFFMPVRMSLDFAGMLASMAWPAAPASSKVPDARILEALVKSTLLTFNDANLTGNYAVLHARLSAPFRQQFPPEKLKASFKGFVEKGIKLDIIAALAPVYDAEPRIDDGRLLVRGWFPTEPTRVVFDLKFVLSEGTWKPHGLNVKTMHPPKPTIAHAPSRQRLLA